ncbi:MULTISPECIES: RraA family protein [unclassified Halomonas]|uniref:RraA family protein n=1 Tax=unclassified Halomonas TaxID=2609666 RepID=UPI000C8DB10D|nr:MULTISPECIES: RraA family protein [unclassified Halomonas]MAR71995.1 acyl transferase [Halomonas sp.]|tara:strand:+ start:1245 stop:1946 length:702 start_codon:yes stop_codon:yes gene_type:complete
MIMTPDLLEQLRRFDTPTIANALDLVRGTRSAEGFTRTPVVAADPSRPPLVGYARCARIRGLTPPDEPAETIRERRMAYYRYIAESPADSLMVIEDEDGDEAVSAFWGEVNTCLHHRFGLLGVLTNGVIRDLDDLEPGFTVLGGRVGPSHAYVRVTAVDTPVRVFGLDVAPGDLIHADRHGAVRLTPDEARALPEAIDRIVGAEQELLERIRRPGFDLQGLMDAWAAFEKRRV